MRRSAESSSSTSASSSLARSAASAGESPNSRACRTSSSRPFWRGSRPASCSATPIRRRTSSGSEATSTPATDALPAVIVSSVVSIFTVVDLPAPLGPRNPNTSPDFTCRSTPRTASTSS